MNPKVKSILIHSIKLTVFLLLLSLVLSYVQYVLLPKTNETEILQCLDILPSNSVDVLFVGSSHVYSTFQPAQLFGEFGIASVNVGTPAQSIPNSYYLIRQLMESHDPKLVVLDLFCLFYPEIAFEESRNHQILDHMPLSLSKVEAAFALSKDKPLDLLFPLSYYHTRWRKLLQEDYQVTKYHAPFVLRDQVEPITTPVILLEENDTTPIPEIPLKYLKKIIKLCEDTNTKLLLTVVPYYPNEDNNNVTWQYQQQIYHSAALVAQTYNVDFFNGLHELDVLDFDFSRDMAEWSHVSFLGSEKVTRFYGNYIKSHYNIPDRSADPFYDEWHNDYRIYHAHLESLKENYTTFPKDCSVGHIDSE